MSDLRLYLRYLAIAVRGQMQYRGAFVTATLGELSFRVLEATSIWALFARFGTLRGYTLAHIAVFYGIVNVGFAFADALGAAFDHFGDRMIRSGEFDRVLLRPRAAVLQIAGNELAIKRVGRLVVGLCVLGWASTQLQLTWDAPRILLAVFACVGATCVFVGVLILQATLCFWTVESLEVMAVMSHGGAEASHYPLSIYDRWLRGFFTYVVPLACVGYFPVVAILDLPDPLGTPRAFQVLAPLAGPLFLGVALWIWTAGVRRYTSTGS
jgi:ABC-2 type transport system permease protein